ncbi:putative cytochrome P450 6a14 [Pseudolycoriella hygida]|uniref:Cytochrome P450 6a14 n=1 Tax=Pseudolycoriella hygida TaxID=35572 RepID=A0A9Q0N3G7_9DIPT|nr:putative cytochrome P450 6a14 [Pseudolycoriella hygida]
MAVVLFISLLVAVLLLLTYYVKYLFSYWSRQGVPSVKPLIPYGNFKGLGKLYFHGEVTQKLYNEMKGNGPFCGVYMFHVPIALALDLDFVKRVLIKDFQYFEDRGMYYNEKDDPLSAHLFAIDGSKWRPLRSKLSATFTSGKMKFMFSTIIAIANEFKSTLDEMLLNKESMDIEMKDLLARFTTDVIGECAFGIECNSLKDPSAEFRNMGRLVFEKRTNGRVIGTILHLFHDFARAMGVRITLPEVEKFFMRIVFETVQYREKNGVQRNDFMDLLIKMKNSDATDRLSMQELAAQVFLFFLAGFETTSTVMAFALYELALNKDIQNKARKEIDNILRKHEGHFSYEAMMEMQYITQIFNESLRKYPPLGNIMRVTTKDYKVPNSNFILRKGTKVWIPAHAIHHDETYFPCPHKFDPDRFSPEEMSKRDNATFLGFGDGPRNCIGLRFGIMQAKIALVTLLSNYDLSICPQSKVPMEIAKKNFILTPSGGMWLNVKRI